MTRAHRLSGSLALLLSLLTGLPAQSEEAVIDSRPIAEFRIGSDETRFGPFEFLGGLEMTSSNRLFGSWSSIRLRPDGEHFVGVLDTGHWITGRLLRDEKGRLSGLTDVDIDPIRDGRGRAEPGKEMSDAEGLALKPGRVLVSFEQFHRVDAYPDPGFQAAAPMQSLPILIPRGLLRANRGFETVAVAPAASPLSGATVIVAEESMDKDDHLYAAILDGPLRGRFSVTRTEDFDPTDGAFLKNGDLLLLERRFNIAHGLGMRIRRIKAAEIRPGALVDGEVLMTASFSHQIDNMEGLESFTGLDGREHILIVSDDNHSILERNLMLEFRLVEE